MSQECSGNNWDGYRAAPITEQTYLQACAFLDALPLGTPAPSVGAEPDGHLTLEWHRSARGPYQSALAPKAIFTMLRYWDRPKHTEPNPFSEKCHRQFWI